MKSLSLIALALFAVGPAVVAQEPPAGARKAVREVVAMPVSPERVSMSGVVVYTTVFGFFAVRDATGLAWVHAPGCDPGKLPASATLPPSPRVGDRVEFSGVQKHPSLMSPRIMEAEWRVVGHEELPAPPLVNELELLKPEAEGRRVRIRGQVVEMERISMGERKITRIWLRAGEQVTSCICTKPGQPAISAKAGDFVEVMGLVSVAVGGTATAYSFSFYVQDAEDIRVLPPPPPPANPMVVRLAGIASGVLIAAGAWIFFLRRQVRARTARLAASEARHRLVVDTALDAVVSIDAQGTITGWNAQAEHTFGWTAAEVLGHPLAETIIPPQHREAHKRGLAHALATGEGRVLNRRIETSALHRDGREFPIELAIAPVEIDGTVSFSAFVRDVTARKQAEAEMLRALERERELGRLKTAFVSMVSHEFRTPLNVIVSSADILARYLDRLPAEERAEHLASIQTSVQRMAGMMGDVLVLGSFEAGRQKYQPQEIHLAAWCRRFLDEMQSATAARCPLKLELGDFEPLVRADETLLRHILANLIGNAVKYSPAGAPVNISVTREGDDAVFRIADRGIGIPATDRARLFEAFQRGSNVGQINGTGLGLVVVKRGVELHGGSIAFTSETGAGTTFTVRLPLFGNPPSESLT